MKKYISIAALALMPFAVSAQTAIEDTESLITVINEWIGYLTILFIVILTLVFIWGAFQWGTAGANEDQKGKGKANMINGIVGIFLIFILWGIVTLVLNSFDVAPDAGLIDAIDNAPITPVGLG